MTKCLAWASLALVLLSACRRSSNGEDAAKGTGSAAAGEDACSARALGLGNVVPTLRFPPPTGCTAHGNAGVMPTRVKDETDFANYFSCTGATSGLDFTKIDLWVVDASLSPAETSVELVNDDDTVTIVEHYRTACPNDPPPMPTGDTIAFLLPHATKPRFERKHCTVTSKCE